MLHIYLLRHLRDGPGHPVEQDLLGFALLDREVHVAIDSIHYIVEDVAVVDHHLHEVILAMHRLSRIVVDQKWSQDLVVELLEVVAAGSSISVHILQ